MDVSLEGDGKVCMFILQSQPVAITVCLFKYAEYFVSVYRPKLNDWIFVLIPHLLFLFWSACPKCLCIGSNIPNVIYVFPPKY